MPEAPKVTDPPIAVAGGLLRRLGAMIYDGLLVIAMWLASLFPMVALTNDAVTGATVQSLLFMEMFAFFAYFWVARGQTLGMLAWRLHVESTTETGHRPGLSPRQALLRFIGAMLAFASLGIGYLWMLWDPRRRTWPDILSGSQVIYRPKMKT